MTEVEAAKQELLTFARQHDEAKAARRKPIRTVLIAAGIGVVVGRLLIGRATRRGLGRRLMGVMVAARLASLYIPAVLRAVSSARQVYRSATGAIGTSSRYRPRAPVDRPQITAVVREPSFTR